MSILNGSPAPLNLKRRLSYVFLLLFSVSTLLMAPACSKQSKKEGHLKQAERYFAAKDFKKAEIEYLNVLQLDRTNAAVAKRLATIYFDQGKVQQAFLFLLGARQLDPDDAAVRTKLGELYLSGGQFQDMRREAIYVLDRSPTNDDAMVLLSAGAETPKDIADSFQRLQNLQSQASNRASWHVAMASLYLRQTNTQAAEGALRKALSLEPNSSRVHLAWGVFYRQQKDHKNAEQSYQKAAELAPQNPHVWLRWADFKLNTGTAREVREILHRLTRNRPDYIPASIFLARLEFDAQNFQECSNIVHRVLVQDQGNYKARILHARLTRVQGKPADAVKELEEVKRVHKGSEEVELDLALAYLQNQDRVKAALSLQETLRLNPNNAQAALLLAEVNIGKGDPTSAISFLQDLAQKQPGLSHAQFLLGSAYSAQGRFDDALALYRTMENRFPSNPAVPFIMGLTLRQQPNRNVEARMAFQRASALATNDLLSINQLVDLDIADKNYPAAFQRVRELLVNVPKSAGAKFLEARIFLAQTNLAGAEAALQQAIDWDPNFGSAYDLLTRTYVAANKLPEALAKLQQMLGKNPKNVQVLMEIALIFEKMNDTSKAVKTYEDLLKISPNFIPALNNLAVLLSEKIGKNDEAYALASRARELAPQEPRIADTLGWIDFRRREFARAVTLLQECAVKLPENPDVQFHAGMAHYMMGQEQPARLAFQRALDRTQEFPGRVEAQKRLAFLALDPGRTDPAVITILQDQIRQQPDDLPALLRLGGIYERTGAPDKARQVYEDARKASPNSASVVLQLTRLYATSLKNPQKALVLAREARKLAPEDAEVAFLLGRLADQSGDHQWASDLLQETARKQPGNPEVLFHLAQALYAIGRVNDAEETMRRAVQVASPSTLLSDGGANLAQEAQSFLAWVALSKTPEKRLEAEPQVQQILKTRPDYLPALWVAGLIHEQRARLQEAKQVYERILADNPQFAPVRKQLAGLYTDQLGDQQKALEHASKAREVLSDDAELAKMLGKIAYRRGDFPNAIRFLQESSLKRTEDAELFYFLGMAHFQRKAKAESKQESKRALDRALALNPDAPFGPEVKKALAELKK